MGAGASPLSCSNLASAATIVSLTRASTCDADPTAGWPEGRSEERGEGRGGMRRLKDAGVDVWRWLSDEEGKGLEGGSKRGEEGRREWSRGPGRA